MRKIQATLNPCLKNSNGANEGGVVVAEQGVQPGKVNHGLEPAQQ
jgi:hypothetical protein